VFCFLLEGGKYCFRGVEVCWVVRVEEVWIKWRVLELLLFFECFVEIVWECLDVDWWDARFFF